MSNPQQVQKDTLTHFLAWAPNKQSSKRTSHLLMNHLKEAQFRVWMPPGYKWQIQMWTRSSMHWLHLLLPETQKRRAAAPPCLPATEGLRLTACRNPVTLPASPGSSRLPRSPLWYHWVLHYRPLSDHHKLQSHSTPQNPGLPVLNLLRSKLLPNCSHWKARRLKSHALEGKPGAPLCLCDRELRGLTSTPQSLAIPQALQSWKTTSPLPPVTWSATHQYEDICKQGGEGLSRLDCPVSAWIPCLLSLPARIIPGGLNKDRLQLLCLKQTLGLSLDPDKEGVGQFRDKIQNSLCHA